MARTVLLVLTLIWVLDASASWYWPFGGDAKERKQRISELMEPASLLIDSAVEKSEEGKVDEAVSEYKKALAELDRIEREHPDRAETPEFATLRNKRAYVNSAIDALLLKQAQQNAKAVSVTDTTELEAKFAKLQAEKKAAKARPVGTAKSGGKAGRKEVIAAVQKDLAAQRYDAAAASIEDLLKANPKDVAALNLRAALESLKGDDAAAAKTLQLAIKAAPESHYAYYNLAKLLLRTQGASGRTEARGLYETGRDMGGPVDGQLEALLK